MMWLSQQAAQKHRTDGGCDVGTVSIGAAAPAVVTDGETRGTALFAPGGYCWRPAAGERVLVLQAGAVSAVAGREMADAPALAAGEVYLYAPGGASIYLAADGSIHLTGTVTLNGQPLTGGGAGDGTETA